MRYLFSFVTYLALVAWSAPADAGFCDHYPLEMITDQDGVTYAVYLSESQIRTSPAWNPEAGEPPLPLSAAHRLAREWAAERYARYDSAEISAISIKRLTACNEFPDRWYFKVEFNPTFDGNRLYGIGNYVVILMNGAVLAPEKSQRTPLSPERPVQPPKLLPRPNQT